MSIAKSATLGAVSALAAAMLAGPAFADGMPSRGKVKAEDPRPCSLSANVGLTTDYVFRGFSQTAEGPAVQGGFDVTCGRFYAGVWASSLDFAGHAFGTPSFGGFFDASIEMDWYAGFKTKTGAINWDLGVIYYSYPNQLQIGSNTDLNYLELKVGASGDVWKDGTLGVTVFYSPDYQLNSGSTWTVEASFSQALPKFGMFSPTFSALVGHQMNEGTASYAFSFGAGNDNYTYWNAGLSLGFLEKWSLDLRYWDTDLPSGFCNAPTFQCDSRFAATLKFTY